MKKIFIEMSSWSQLFFLWLFFFVGFLLSSIIVTFLAFFFVEGGNVANMAYLLLESPDYIRVAQLVQQLFLFFVPACFCAYLFNKNGASYLKINKGASFDTILVALFLVFAIQPLINFTSFYNQQIVLPEFLSGVELWMKNTERKAVELTERMLSGDSFDILLLNLFIVAVVAAVVEEFFFRGVLQQIFNKITRNYHWAVWIAAFIFSAVHMQFYGFIPRLLLGALLGYLFVYSGSLWVPIGMHFVNNAMGVLVHHFYSDTPYYETIENIGTKDMWWSALLSFILVVVILSYIGKEYRQKSKHIYF